jgi:hypothetical protein
MEDAIAGVDLTTRMGAAGEALSDEDLAAGDDELPGDDQ